jgi:hypothetical protein
MYHMGKTRIAGEFVGREALHKFSHCISPDELSCRRWCNCHSFLTTYLGLIPLMVSTNSWMIWMHWGGHFLQGKRIIFSESLSSNLEYQKRRESKKMSEKDLSYVFLQMEKYNICL